MLIPLTAQAADLTLTPLTWNVIGLDSNNVNVGPNNFPVGARACNTGTALTDVTATFQWEAGGTDNGTYINLRSGSLDTITLPMLAAGTPADPSCHDFYFEVSVTRDSNAYDKSRRYYIELSSNETGTYSTPRPRELYVEHLISQNRNSTDAVSYKPLGGGSFTPVAAGGNLTLQLGNSYTIRLDASTATQGYNQLEDFINFPNTIFQVLAVRSQYSANSSAYVANTSDKLYADACLWDMDPESATYLSCIGGDGKTGGTISTEYDLKIIGGVGTTQPLSTLIYDFSGSSFHYNADYSSAARFAVIASPVALNKSFSPVSVAPNADSTLTLTINNASGSTVSGISLTDVMPSGVTISAAAASQCGGTVASDANSLTLSGGSIAAGSSCTVTATVSAALTGTYTNTTQSLRIVDGTTGVVSDTGLTASANLIVEDSPSASCTPVTIAEWTIPPTGAAPPVRTDANTSVTALASSNATNDINSGYWRITSGLNYTLSNLTSDFYYRFQVDTSSYSDVKMAFTYYNSANGGPTVLDLYYGNSANPADLTLGAPRLTITPAPTTSDQTTPAIDFPDGTNASGDTYFYLYPHAASNAGVSNWIGVKGITFTGCQTPGTLTKSFSPSTVAEGQTTTLTFTVSNAAGSEATDAAFTDALPAGLTVGANGVTANTCGIGTVTAAPGSSVIELSGGTVPANGQCTFAVEVEASSAGTFLNTTGYLSIHAGVTTSQASDTLTVLAPPVISKAFAPSIVYASSSGASPAESMLTFNISNPNLGAGMDLTGVSFTDNLAANLTVSGTASTSCTGGSVTAPPGATSIVLSGASIAAGENCMVSVPVAASVVGSYPNSVTVSSTNGGTGNTSTSTLQAQTVHPGIGLLKQVSTSPSGPWASTTFVAPGSDIYYRFTIENIGDVPLTDLSVTDPDLGTLSCVWPSVLPVGSATVAPTASCVHGPVTAATAIGPVPNTAGAAGKHNNSDYFADSTALTTATYVVTVLNIDKSATSGSPFEAAGDVITYEFVVTNTGAFTVPGPVTVTDTNSTVSCPAGDLAAGASITCTSSYTVTAYDVSVGSVSNSAYATASTVRSNIDRVIVFKNDPDLIVTKTNSVGGYALTDTPFDWTLAVANQGPQNAVFTTGDVILRDPLPSTGATYGAPVPGSFIDIVNSANISCSIDGSQVLTCVANGADVTITGTTGTFEVVVPVTPTVTGSLVNAAAVVDPNNVVPEGSEGNNTGADAVNVDLAPASADLSITKTNGVTSVTPGGSVTYTIVASNAGPSSVTGATVADTLPAALTNATWTCVGSGSGTCSASGSGNINDTVDLPAGGAVTYTVTATVSASASGSLSNTATVTSPISDPTPANNSASDTDTLTPSADLSITKTDGVTTVTPGGSVTYTIVASNAGPSNVTGATVADTLPAALTNVSWTCAGSGGGTCSASGSGNINDSVNLPAGGSVTFTVSATVSAGATGTISNTATVSSPVTDPTPGNNSATDADTVQAAPVPGSVAGHVWYDLNGNNLRDNNEPGRSGWLVQLLQGNTVIDSTTSGSDGGYSFPSLTPGTYAVRFIDPNNTTGQSPMPVNGDGAGGGNPTLSELQNIVVGSGTNLVEQSLPIDPSGVVYDSVTRLPLAGATVTLNGPAGFNPATDLAGGTATVVTESSGRYAFFLLNSAPAGTYTLTVNLAGYRFVSTLIPPTAGEWPQGGAAITGINGAPQDGQDTTYYLSGPKPTADVTNNNIPLDPSASVTAVPTLDQQMMVLMGLLLLLVGGAALRRQPMR